MSTTFYFCMLPIKEQISKVYRNKSFITFLHVRVYRGFMCFSGKKRKHSCFAGNNSLFYVLFSLTVIALTWKLSWHFVGNKNVKRMFFAGSFTRVAPQSVICGRGICNLTSDWFISMSNRNVGAGASLLTCRGSVLPTPLSEEKKKRQLEKMLRRMFSARGKQK